MTNTHDPLLRDLVQWIAKEPRTYTEVMEAWRTHCPRLTIWEDAVDQGLVARRNTKQHVAVVSVTPRGLSFLAEKEGC